MLLSWYSYSITYIWNGLGKLFIWSFHLLAKIDGLINLFYVLLLSFLFILWNVIMRNYYKDHKDKGLIQ
jgi:hypothetical protein